MGAEFKRGQLVTNKSAIKRRLNAIIQNDYASRRSEEDMYRGDWGSSSVRENPIIEFDLKTRTERAWGKRQEVFLDLEFEKYVIDWAIINEEGYTKLKPKLVIAKGVRGPYFIKSDYRVMEFKTQAEIKDLLRGRGVNHLIGEEVFVRGPVGGQVVVGRIENAAVVTKSKPKNVPDYLLETIVRVEYAGWTPV